MPHRAGAALGVDFRPDHHAALEAAVGDAHLVHVQAGQGARGVGDLRRRAVGSDHPPVAHLAARHRVEGSPVENDEPLLPGLEPPRERPVLQHREDAGVLHRELRVAEEVRLPAFLGDLHVDGVALHRAHLARLPGPLLLRRQLALEARVVHAEAPVCGELIQEVERKAVRVVEAEGVPPVDPGAGRLGPSLRGNRRHLC